MHIGAMYFPTDQDLSPDRLAIELEQRGWESLWVTEHTHIPTERRTPWPGGAELPDYYTRIWDPLVALASAAATTSTLRLATGVCLVSQHHPLSLAKSVATLDLLSRGRVIFGVGVGWNDEEMENHGVDPARRRARAREHILAVRALWTREIASFEGEFVSFSPSWSWPKPVQEPHPPIIMGGGGGPVTFGHIIEYCQGWMPLHGRGDVFAKIGQLRRQSEEAGRDPDTIEVTVMACPSDLNLIEGYARAGVARCVMLLPPAPDAKVLEVLERRDPVVVETATWQA